MQTSAKTSATPARVQHTRAHCHPSVASTPLELVHDLARTQLPRPNYREVRETAIAIIASRVGEDAMMEYLLGKMEANSLAQLQEVTYHLCARMFLAGTHFAQRCSL